MTLTLIITVFFYGIFVGAVLQTVETEALENERSRTEVFKEDIDSKLGRLFYFPVWIYAKVTDHFDRKEEERAS